MVIMLHLNQALLSIQLVVMCHGLEANHWSELVFRGKSVTLTCNRSMINATQVNWTKGRFLFAYKTANNGTVSNFTSNRQRIDVDFHSKLNIFNAQHEDAGLYRCDVSERRGTWVDVWNLTVSEEREEINQPFRSLYFLYITAAVIGLLVFAITSAVCLYRRLGTRTPNGEPIQDQFSLPLDGKVDIPHPQADRDNRTNKKRRSQYTERLNSIYGL
ncbi:uncharacterized protein LOC118282941 isoform X2 [Scophthalmus maximus]|uniref:uncharacterized protein LOC118282941 isoform X2 n=1 Tax=Scophthalmus maximus TaxID=52904 RepID=UPI0015E0C371|nr:uncharacterized protein LOC118282941 isoform X2 [Scophthalmus maximus]